ncbi:UDP-3-O-(3-hydroxymyristoyl)glucosamine N-acyltransferase [Persephonella sp.]
MKLSEIAKIVNGRLINLKEDIEIKSLAALENAVEGDLTFVASRKFFDLAHKTKASALLTKEELNIDKPQIIVENPDQAFYKIVEIFYPEEKIEGYISDKAVIGNNVHIEDDVYIGDFVVIQDNVRIGRGTKIYPFSFVGKNCVIGENTIIYPRVTLYPDVIVGKNVILHSGVVVGSDGFGYYQKNGKHIKIKHVGKVVIEDNVEIGANTTIDRAMIDKTVVGKGTKIDNLVMVAHNCQIGENCIILGQAGMAGSCKIGNYVILAGQVGVADHINIGDNVIVIGKSSVPKDLPSNGIYGSSIPAMEWNKWKRILAYLSKLPDILKKFKS